MFLLGGDLYTRTLVFWHKAIEFHNNGVSTISLIVARTAVNIVIQNIVGCKSTLVLHLGVPALRLSTIYYLPEALELPFFSMPIYLIFVM